MRRKISIFISVLLLLVLSAGSFFYYAFLSCSQMSLKVEAHASISQKDCGLEIIKLPASSFNKHDDEIWYHGHLYDIASWSVNQDTVTIKVLQDEKEEGLVNIISNYFSASGDSYCSYDGHHISSKHTINPNDVKSLCERVNIPSTTFSLSMSFSTKVFDIPLPVSKSVDSPPPKA